mmetsp:Transcript_11686/g.23078  ORF Transcript_11686/g.23078 Transcript_11686/m.23078 type:complete len:259 (-) Transcript_11686:700-1476(-)
MKADPMATPSNKLWKKSPTRMLMMIAVSVAECACPWWWWWCPPSSPLATSSVLASLCEPKFPPETTICPPDPWGRGGAGYDVLEVVMLMLLAPPHPLAAYGMGYPAWLLYPWYWGEGAYEGRAGILGGGCAYCEASSSRLFCFPSFVSASVSAWEWPAWVCSKPRRWRRCSVMSPRKSPPMTQVDTFQSNPPAMEIASGRRCTKTSPIRIPAAKELTMMLCEKTEARPWPPPNRTMRSAPQSDMAAPMSEPAIEYPQI